ncbi:hypothetical protein SCLCIDRAFT_1225511 [Scleroderma citrinum Foug A]|uniref:Uncharacterized protein n=1 Tax=Scleroderma citrinum Foug A TaxID=1036808 RepID=A0A0C3CMP2_9AGAM|nr:hypothetical protein SCLCIDRAFT_1225511 [Scleroderma citrinum Foug A]
MKIDSHRTAFPSSTSRLEPRGLAVSDEKVGEEEIPASQETVAERPVEDNVKDQIKPAENKGKAVDRAWTSLLLMG